MQVKIEHSCFIDKGNHQDLDTIFSFFVEGQHKWIDIDLEEIEKTEWHKNLGKRDVDDLKTIFVGSTRKSNSKKTISVYNETKDEFNVFEAKFYLKQPLTIIVENYEYEPIFINTVIEKFDNSNELIDAKNMQWLSYENGGGANDNTLNGKLNESYNHPKLTKQNNRYLRCYVIKDSDREYCIINADQTVTLQEVPKSKTKILEENFIPFHILHKREKENYMPDRIYNSFLQSIKRKDKRKDFAKVYLKMDVHQKDFLDIEKGFTIPKSNPKSIKDRTALKTEVIDLYSNLSHQDYKTIGFGLDYPNLKTEFSKEFSKVSKDDLERRINHQPLIKSKIDDVERNEFEHIIHEIKYLL
jgi:hypothetical protein